MLNIISRSYVSKRTTGPSKVVRNFIKGLEKIGYPFVVNASLDATKQVWVHDDTIALAEVAKRTDLHAIVGPNLYVTPRQIPTGIDLSNLVYLHPSPWVVELWKKQGYDRSPLIAWPTGIDVAEFPISKEDKKHVLIYFKERFPEELTYAKNILNKLEIPYEVIIYGSYKEDEYRKQLSQAKYVLWIGRQESQGIALEEALATNTPILVWDVPHLGHWQASAKNMSVFSVWENKFTGATSAFYFDSSCGIIFKDKTELAEKLTIMEESYPLFTPRSFIENNLSLEKQAQDLLNIFKSQYQVTDNDLLNTHLNNQKKWRNGKALFRFQQRLKDALRSLIR